MPAWLSFLAAIFGTIGFFAAFYGVVLAVIERKRGRGKPQIKICRMGAAQLGVWVTWKPDTFDLQVYRLRFQLIQPEGIPKDTQFTISYDPPQKAPFLQPVELPSSFATAIQGGKNGIIQIEFRTTEELCQVKLIRLPKLKRFLEGNSPPPSGVTPLALAKPDVATVTSLDFSELQVRAKKLKDLEAAAKAKAAKAPPKPAAVAPTGGATTVPVSPPVKAPAPTPVVATQDQPVTKPVPLAPSVPSIKSVIAKENAKNVPPPKSANEGQS